MGKAINMIKSDSFPRLIEMDGARSGNIYNEAPASDVQGGLDGERFGKRVCYGSVELAYARAGIAASRQSPAV